MTLRRLIIVLAGVACIGAANAQDAPPLVGRWQYLQPPDDEGEVLDISLEGGRYRGIMNGLERAGEHGLFYYVVEATDLRVSPNGEIRFIVGPRSFFTKRPPLAQLAPGPGDGGVTRESMQFEGKIADGKLILTCKDAGGSCPDARLRFERIAPAR